MRTRMKLRMRDGREVMANKAFNVFICGRQNLKVAACSSLVGLCGRTRDKMVATAAGQNGRRNRSCNMLLLLWPHALKGICLTN